MKLTEQGKMILNVIHNHLKTTTVSVSNLSSFLGYKQVHDILGIKRGAERWGRSLDIQGLGDLAEWVKARRLPAVTGLVIDQDKMSPGGRFYTINQKSELADGQWWLDQAKLAIEHDWSQYLDVDELYTPNDIELVEESFDEGGVNDITSKKRMRSAALKKKTKEYFKANNRWHCNACLWSLETDKLKGDILEIHHQRPLSQYYSKGETLSFDQAVKNLVPLCPRCHKIAHAGVDGEIIQVEDLKKFVL